MAWGRSGWRIMRQAVLYATVICACFMVGFPIFWALVSSLKVREEMFAFPVKVVPSALTLRHYDLLWSTTRIPRFLMNSLVVAVGTSIITTVGAALGAYSLTRFPFSGRKYVARGILVCYMLPSILLSIPLFIMFRQMAITNTRIGLMGAHVTTVLPFVIWLLWGFFREIPLEIEEAAKIDGAGRLRVLLTVFVPIALPGIAAGMIFSFIVSWAEYLFASVMATKEEVMTVPVFLAMMSGLDILRWEFMLAAVGMITLPVLIIVAVFQQYLLRGFAAPTSK